MTTFIFEYEFAIEPKHLLHIEKVITEKANAMLKNNEFRKPECIYAINDIKIKSIQIIYSSIICKTLIYSLALFPEVNSVFTGIITTIIPNNLCIVKVENLYIFIRPLLGCYNINDTVKIKIQKKLFTKGIVKLIGQII